MFVNVSGVRIRNKNMRLLKINILLFMTEANIYELSFKSQKLLSISLNQSNRPIIKTLNVKKVEKI